MVLMMVVMRVAGFVSQLRLAPDLKHRTRKGLPAGSPFLFFGNPFFGICFWGRGDDQRAPNNAVPTRT